MIKIVSAQDSGLTSEEKTFTIGKARFGMSDDKLARGSSRPLPSLRNPRIVQVSRASGGKDRHSKVTTVKGLRDRRIRLSVPTAIQLYDLQNKLGLGQPSKALDWLLNAAHHEIDKLPPLEMLPAGNNFSQYPDQSINPISDHQLGSTSNRSTDHTFNINNAIEDSMILHKSSYWNIPNVHLMTNKDRSEYSLKGLNIEKGNSSKQDDYQNEDGCLDINYGIPFGSYYDQLEPSQEHLSHSHPIRSHLPPQAYGLPVYMAGTSNLDQKQYFSHLKMENFDMGNLKADAFRSSFSPSKQPELGYSPAKKK